MKIIFSDFDGTLYVDKKISKRDREAIKKWQQAGNLFGLVTGRDEHSIHAELGDQSLHLDFIIGNNGAVVNGENYASVSMEDIKVIESFDNIKESKHLLFFSQGNRYLLPLKEATESDMIHKIGVELIENSGINNLLDVAQISLEFVTAEKAYNFSQKINQVLKTSMATPNNNFVDITAKDVNKANGIRSYFEVEKMHPSSFWVIGDAENDLSMIRKYGGTTLEHAAPQIKKEAKQVVKDIAELIEMSFD